MSWKEVVSHRRIHKRKKRRKEASQAVLIQKTKVRNWKSPNCRGNVEKHTLVLTFFPSL